jgi:hypothetical protein
MAVIDGTYHIAGEGMGVKLDGTLDLQTSGSTLTGSAHILGRDIPIQNGKVKGDTLTATIEAPTPMGHMKFKVNATVDGEKISGTLKALMASADFYGKRL